MQNDMKAQDFPTWQMRRFLAHLNARAWPGLPRLMGMSWRRARARARAFGNARVSNAIAAYENGEIANFRDLKIVTSVIALTRDHQRYEDSLRLFDDTLSLPGARGRAAFVGYGIGGGSLNVYRTIGGARFEKIYLRKSACLRRMSFAYAEILPRLRDLRTPALLETGKGERIAVARFEAITPRPVPHFDLEAAVEAVQAFAALDLSDISIPPDIRNFRKKGYGNGQEILFTRIRRRHPTRAEALIEGVQRLEKRVAACPGVFAHGDLNRTNFAADGHVIDWDSAGVYPYGFDAAYVANQSTRFSDIAQLEAFFGRYFERPGEAEEDRIAFLFFFLHFMQNLPRQRTNHMLFDQLLERLDGVPG